MRLGTSRRHGLARKDLNEKLVRNGKYRPSKETREVQSRGRTGRASINKKDEENGKTWVKPLQNAIKEMAKTQEKISIRRKERADITFTGKADVEPISTKKPV